MRVLPRKGNRNRRCWDALTAESNEDTEDCRQLRDGEFHKFKYCWAVVWLHRTAYKIVIRKIQAMRPTECGSEDNIKVNAVRIGWIVG
jgi:hypothetical protein